MAQLTIQLSSKAEALIAQLQKQIFNRRRKKVSAAGVVETLLESGAKSQSDKRFATSWRNLIDDIEKAAAITHRHGTKPTAISDQEWALILSHRSRSGSLPEAAVAAKPSPRQPAAAKAKATLSTTPTPARTKAVAAKPKATKPAPTKAAPKVAKVAPNVAKAASVAKAAPKVAKTTAKPTAKATTKSAAKSSLAKRMAKAVSRLSTATVVSSSNGEGPQPAAAPPALSQP
jgi:septal ring-binding cell division protein DamX